MQEFDIPIFKKSYELYKTISSFRNGVPKQDRYTLWQRVENTTLDIFEYLLSASSRQKIDKVPILEKASDKLNLLRVLLRLAKDTKALDNKKYLVLEELIDEIGRMLGGWIKSAKE